MTINKNWVDPKESDKCEKLPKYLTSRSNLELYKVLEELQHITATMVRIEEQINNLWSRTTEEIKINQEDKKKDLFLAEIEANFHGLDNFNLVYEWLRKNL